VRPAATVSTAAQYPMNNRNSSTFSPCDVDRIFPLPVGDFFCYACPLSLCVRSSSTSVFRIGALVTVARLYLFCYATSDSHFTTRGLFGLHCFMYSLLSLVEILNGRKLSVRVTYSRTLILYFHLLGAYFMETTGLFERHGSFPYPPLLPLEVEWLISLL
jgi:hypothetical protein